APSSRKQRRRERDPKGTPLADAMRMLSRRALLSLGATLLGVASCVGSAVEAPSPAPHDPVGSTAEHDAGSAPGFPEQPGSSPASSSGVAGSSGSGSGGNAF